MTNYEKIKQMSIDELAEMLLDESEKSFKYCNYCKYQTFFAPHCAAGSDLKQGYIQARLKWLEKEAD